jgi:AraC-like DNA-binding protein
MDKTTNPQATDGYLGTSISGWGRSVLLALLALDIDGRKIFRDCGLDPNAQGRSLVRNPVTKMQYVWQMAESGVEDKNLLATQIVRYLNASSFHALGFGLYASSSIKGLFRRLCLYREVISSSVDMRYDEDQRHFNFRIIDLRPVKSHLTSVVMLLFLLRICHELSGPELSPTRVYVPWPEGNYDDAIRDQTSAPIHHHEPHHGFTFRREDAEKTLPSAQSQLASFQDNLCRDYLHSLEEHRHLPSRVRLKIVQGLTSENARIESIASSLHMSPRTLQRKLKMEGTNFHDILREARKELVTQYAVNVDLSATQIAYLLGFSGIAQFAAAFKSWFGETFTEFRQRLTVEP